LTDTSETDVPGQLAEAYAGELAADSLFEKVYLELRRLAGEYLRDERPGHTLQPTALVHEAYLRLTGGRQIVWQNRAQFFSVAAQVMRHILVDHARRRAAGKRGHGGRRLALDEALDFASERDINFVALDETLYALAALDEEQARIVELRFFGGLSIRETAQALGISEMTVSRKWGTAKLWLHEQLKRDGT
jgi:RNA polymerase sigma factor (TIGR02999 family)